MTPTLELRSVTKLFGEGPSVMKFRMVVWFYKVKKKIIVIYE